MWGIEFIKTCHSWLCPHTYKSPSLWPPCFCPYPPSIYSKYNIAAILRCFTITSFSSFAQNLSASCLQIKSQATCNGQGPLTRLPLSLSVPAILASFLSLKHNSLPFWHLHFGLSLSRKTSLSDLYGSHSQILQIFAQMLPSQWGILHAHSTPFMLALIWTGLPGHRGQP